MSRDIQRQCFIDILTFHANTVLALFCHVPDDGFRKVDVDNVMVSVVVHIFRECFSRLDNKKGRSGSHPLIYSIDRAKNPIPYMAYLSFHSRASIFLHLWWRCACSTGASSLHRSCTSRTTLPWNIAPPCGRKFGYTSAF